MTERGWREAWAAIAGECLPQRMPGVAELADALIPHLTRKPPKAPWQEDLMKAKATKRQKFKFVVEVAYTVIYDPVTDMPWTKGDIRRSVQSALDGAIGLSPRRKARVRKVDLD